MKPSNGTKKRAGYNLFNSLALLDKLTIAYVLITALYICIVSSRLTHISEHLLLRLAFVSGIFLVSYAGRVSQNFFVQFAWTFYPFFLIIYLYPETAYLNTPFKSYDGLIVHYEQLLFGCLPFMKFSALYPQKWFSALMHFGYFSYYAIISLLALMVYFFARQHSEKVNFISIFCFYSYYVIFILFPTYGPLFYFPKSMLYIPDGGVFKTFVNMAQDAGERATAAFPSSHVGMAIILSYLGFKYYKPAFYVVIIPSILICFATIYVKAHYMIDVIGGFVSAPIFLFISYKAYYFFTSSNRKNIPDIEKGEFTPTFQQNKLPAEPSQTKKIIP